MYSVFSAPETDLVDAVLDHLGRGGASDSAVRPPGSVHMQISYSLRRDLILVCERQHEGDENVKSEGLRRLALSSAVTAWGPDLRIDVVCCSWSLAIPLNMSEMVCTDPTDSHRVNWCNDAFRIRSRRRGTAHGHLAGSECGFASASCGIAFFRRSGVDGFVSRDGVRGQSHHILKLDQVITLRLRGCLRCDGLPLYALPREGSTADKRTMRDYHRICSQRRRRRAGRPSQTR